MLFFNGEDTEIWPMNVLYRNQYKYKLLGSSFTNNTNIRYTAIFAFKRHKLTNSIVPTSHVLVLKPSILFLR